jgi:hypothetical protein
MIKSFYWRLVYSRWKKPSQKQVSGYSVLVMVPGDLPVFLPIALDVCSRQQGDHLVEILVIPDNLSCDFLNQFELLKTKWTKCPIRLLKLNFVELWMTKYFRNPGINNWLQFVKGCNEAVSTHVLWHDADLFIGPPDFFKNHYEQCVQGEYSCYGVNEVWDKWYKENGFMHLASTWELMLDLKWVRSFKPWQHRGHDGEINGKLHTFDSTLLPQCLTEPRRIGYQQCQDDFVHFNYTISSYRRFQKKENYEDKGFKIFLIRLLLELYDETNSKTEIPSLTDLTCGLQDKNQRVTYLHESRKRDYVRFRGKLKELINSDALIPARKKLLQNRVCHFDRHFNVNEV